MLDIFKFPAWAIQLSCIELAECRGMTRSGETEGETFHHHERAERQYTIFGSGGPNKDAERDIERLGLQGVDERCSKKQISDRCFAQKIMLSDSVAVYELSNQERHTMLSA